MRRLYGVLSAGLLALGVIAAGGGIASLASSSKADVNAEIGKWLLTVAAGLVITGALSMVVKQIDQRRGEREAWHAVLNDLVASNQTVTLARLRLLAHQSAKTYQEQLAELMAARVELRRLLGMGILDADPSLRDRIRAMLRYLDDLGREYEKGYLWVSRQQRLDEVWLTAQMDFAKQRKAQPLLPPGLAGPPTAWLLLRRAARFPRLARLLDSDVFKIDAFRTNYKLAKGRLETNAGFNYRRAGSNRAKSARKLSDRAKEFLEKYPNLPDEVAARLSRGLEELDSECARRRLDRRAIDAATLEVTTAIAQGVDAIFVATEDSVSPPQGLAVAGHADGELPLTVRGIRAQMAMLRSMFDPHRARSM